MKSMAAILALALMVAPAQAASATPIEKVLTMLADLETKIIGEGTDAQKVYDEFSEFCEDRSKSVGFEIKTGKSDKKSLGVQRPPPLRRDAEVAALHRRR